MMFRPLYVQNLILLKKKKNVDFVFMVKFYRLMILNNKIYHNLKYIEE